MKRKDESRIIKEIKLRFKDKIDAEEQQIIKRIEQQREADRLASIEAEKEAIRIKMLLKEKKRALEREVLAELVQEGLVLPEAGKRPLIPRKLVNAVWLRDKGKCVYCGSTENLHLDYILPFSNGGAVSIENLQLLCQKCNSLKTHFKD